MTTRAKSILRNPASNLLLISYLAWTLGLAQPSFALDEVNLHISAGVSGNALLYKFTKEKGFYREEGLEVLPIQAGMLPGIQGLVGGSFDFSQILGQGAGAILRGVPLKIVMVFDTRPLNWLYARKEIKSLQELKGGKQIAVSSFGAALDQMTRDLLPKHGINPQKDVVLRAVEPTPNRLAALMSGAVDAAVVNQMDRIIAKKNGFNELLFYGDDLEFVTAGAVTTERTLAQRPELVHKFLRGTLRGFHWLKNNEKEVVARMVPIMKVSEAEATDVYRAWLRVMSVDGTIPRSLQEKMIAFQRKSLKVERDVAPDNVYELSIVRSLNEEMRKNK
ncbi:MAG TPA: ABC transporter substrate-binding protein [Candidatus Binatia bacterium]|nr:ABC transporter substrate-binding protein [Candidatus Binatia bacterium]